MATFQVRSAHRDQQTDRQRVKAVVETIDAAVASAQEEMSALNARVNNARDLAAFAAGNEIDEYLTRELKDTQRIAEYERQLIAGDKRLASLKTHIADLLSVRESCRDLFQKTIETND